MRMRSGLGKVVLVALLPVLAGQAEILKYGDGKPDGRKSLGGNGELLKVTAPSEKMKVVGVKIHGSRYGLPAPPKEDFTVYILGEDMAVLHTEKAPYKLFERGEAKWVNVSFKKPAEVPATFWVCLDFNAEQTKGVYVSYDTSTDGQHSKIGLPGQTPEDVEFGGDWMIQVNVSQ